MVRSPAKPEGTETGCAPCRHGKGVLRRTEKLSLNFPCNVPKYRMWFNSHRPGQPLFRGNIAFLSYGAPIACLVTAVPCLKLPSTCCRCRCADTCLGPSPHALNWQNASLVLVGLPRSAAQRSVTVGRDSALSPGDAARLPESCSSTERGLLWGGVVAGWQQKLLQRLRRMQ